MVDEDFDSFDDFSDLQPNGLYQLSQRPRLDSRMSVCIPSKGLFNGPGENNCFLNACVQLLWHLNVFRRSFRLLEGHACSENACIFCALKQLFHDFEASDQTVLAPNALREAMANSFMDDHRFQLGRMDDAAECLENILQRLHNHIAHHELEDTCSAQHCIPHQKFAFNIVEQVSCECKSTGEPKSYYQFVHYVTASSLANSSTMQTESGHPLTLGEKLKHIAQTSETRPCPDEAKCILKDKNVNTYVQTTLINTPDVVSIGIIWDTDRPSSKYIVDVMASITESLYIADMFDNVLDEELKELKLAGVITYYGKHYTSFFYNVREQQWTYFDDAHVDMIGSQWDCVMNKCYKNRYQPLLFIYSNGSGLPVDTKYASNTVKIVSQERLLKPPVRRKAKRHHSNRHRHHKKGRSRSHSPADSLLSTDRPFSSQSSSSQSPPNSPEKSYKSPRTDRRNKHKSLTLDNSYMRSSSNSPHRKYNSLNHQDIIEQQNNLINEAKKPQIKTSSSDGDIIDLKNRIQNGVDMLNNSFDSSRKNLQQQTQNGDLMNNSFDSSRKYLQQPTQNGDLMNNSFDSNDSNDQRKRTGSLKKKFGNVMKTITPIIQTFKNSKPFTNEQMEPTLRSSLNESDFADIGFNSPYARRDKNIKSSKANDLESRLSNTSDTFDKTVVNQEQHMNNLIQHVENLNVSLSDVKLNGIRSDNNISDSEYRSNGIDNHNQDNSDINNLTVHNNDTYSDPFPTKDVDTEMVRNGHRNNDFRTKELGTEMVRNEYRNKDLIYFNSRPEVVTSVTSQPSELESLIDHGDRLTLESEYHEQKGDLLLALRLNTDATASYRDASKLANLDDDLLQFVDQKRQESFARSKYLQQNVGAIMRNGNTATMENKIVTSDYGSMSDPPSSGPNTPNWETMTSNQNVDDLVDLQNRNAKQLALNRLHRDDVRNDRYGINTLMYPLNYTDKTIYDEAIERQNQSNNIRNDYNITNINTDLQNPKTDIRWVVDKPNNTNETLVMPDIPTDKTFKNSKNHENKKHVKKHRLPKPPVNSSKNRTSPTTIYDHNDVILSIGSKENEERVAFDTLQKLKAKQIGRLRCSQCGFREVETYGQCCQFCQSEYL